jgi:hypothetical protein
LARPRYQEEARQKAAAANEKQEKAKVWHLPWKNSALLGRVLWERLLYTEQQTARPMDRDEHPTINSASYALYCVLSMTRSYQTGALVNP